ncbi:MAG: hypothetical protein AAFX40_09835 [Cyanobacteria bacterium J06639_1]
MTAALTPFIGRLTAWMPHGYAAIALGAGVAFGFGGQALAAQWLTQGLHRLQLASRERCTVEPENRDDSHPPSNAER